MLEYYPSHRDYLYALADALHEEYKAITDAGFILQIDRAAQNPVLNLAGDDVIREMELGVEVVNHALRGIPEERVRSHWCSGSGNRAAHAGHPVAQDRADDAEAQSAGLRIRGRQSAPRARVPDLGRHQAARGQDSHARADLADQPTWWSTPS